MANTCNKLIPGGIGLRAGTEQLTVWDRLYLDNEGLIESGSAYFAQAFAEAMAIIADIELHDLGRAELRVKSIDRTLEAALRMYLEASDLADAAGLTEHHSESLLASGVTAEVLRDTLDAASADGLLLDCNSVGADLVGTYDAFGFAACMREFVERLGAVKEFNAAFMRSESPAPIAWQEYSWGLTARMSRTMVFGQAIAMLNTLTLRRLGKPPVFAPQSKVEV